MIDSEGQIGKSEGKTKLQRQCLDEARVLGLNVTELSWSRDVITKEWILTIEAKTGTNQIPFSEKEIEDYHRDPASMAINDKIQEALRQIGE